MLRAERPSPQRLQYRRQRREPSLQVEYRKTRRGDRPLASSESLWARRKTTFRVAEHLPYPDESFDVVLSQFGHMFAPRPDLALAEMRRVLKSGGRIAFATWPPEHFVGRFFAFVARHSPPPPEGAAPPPLWGVVSVVMERLSNGFDIPFFERGVMRVPALSLPHLWNYMSASIGPLQKIVEHLASEPEQLSAVRQEMFDLAEPYFSNNIMHQDYLLTRANAR